jgi:hypothetical protein
MPVKGGITDVTVNSEVTLFEVVDIGVSVTYTPPDEGGEITSVNKVFIIRQPRTPCVKWMAMLIGEYQTDEQKQVDLFFNTDYWPGGFDLNPRRYTSIKTISAGWTADARVVICSRACAGATRTGP